MKRKNKAPIVCIKIGRHNFHKCEKVNLQDICMCGYFLSDGHTH